jgi:hypothetical protein
MKNPERLKKVALERSKMFLKTKLAEYGPEGCTKDEIKKLTSWGYYNPYTYRNRRGNNYSSFEHSPPKVEKQEEEQTYRDENASVNSGDSLCSRFSKRSHRQKKNL